MATWSNNTKNTTTLVNQTKNSHQTRWSEALFTWAEATGMTWLTQWLNTDKNTTSLSNQVRN